MQKRVTVFSHAEAGWMMVESIVALFLLGLILALCLPTWTQVRERTEREVFLQAVATQLELAQIEAVSREEEVHVQIQSAQQKIQVKQGDQCLREMAIPQRYRLSSNYDGDQIIFRKTGQVLGGTLQLQLEGRFVGQIVVQVASGIPKVVLQP
jgi:type II secretory pathway pseudopilin PulG